MTVRLCAWIGYLTALLVVGGCTASSRGYVEENSQGFVEVRGRIDEVHDLNTRQWEDLSDGFAVKVGKQGCEVKISQSEVRTATYVLQANDTIVFGGDFDFLLTRSPTEKKSSSGSTPAAAKDEGQDAGPGEGEGEPAGD